MYTSTLVRESSRRYNLVCLMTNGHEKANSELIFLIVIEDLTTTYYTVKFHSLLMYSLRFNKYSTFILSPF